MEFKTLTSQRIEELRQIVLEKREVLLKRRGLVLLDPMTDEERQVIKNIVSEIPDVRRFSILLADNRKAVVLRYHNPIKGLDKKELLDKAKWSFNHGRYDVALGCYFNLMQCGGLLDKDYKKIAECFKKKRNKREAQKYQKVAAGIKCKLLQRSKESIQNDSNSGVIFEYKQDYFDEDRYYGVGCFEKINELILATGMDIKSACTHFGLSAEENDLVILNYAKQYFLYGMEQIGEKLLKAYSSSQNKTPKTKMIFEEIKRNKRLYLLQNSSTCELTLTLKIK